MANYKRFPPCIHCGAQMAKATLSFAANDGEIPAWDLRCEWCGKHYMAAMFPLPANASASALDESLRARRRNDKRRKFGYVPDPYKHPTRGAKRISSDRIIAEIRIHPGHVMPTLRARINKLHAHLKSKDRKVEIA